MKQRDHGLCFRCGDPGVQWHHRRTRQRKDYHRHCACNGLWVCSTCHLWIHEHTQYARDRGWILLPSTPFPGGVPALSRTGPARLFCDGRCEPWSPAVRVVCPYCKKTVQARVPAGGDGSAVRPYRHDNADGVRCRGASATMVEWNEVLDDA